MPEGPEVKSMVNKLETFINSTLKEIKIISGRYIHHGPPKNFDSLKLPLKIIDIKTHGKFTIINLNHTIYIYITLGMTGFIGTDYYNHLRITFKTSKGNFYLDDTRNFAQLQILNCKEHQNKIKSFGYDPLGKKMPFEQFLNYFKSFKSNWIIADALMKQNFISGIGNYLRAEILYETGIDPFCEIGAFDNEMIKLLYNYTHKIIKHSYNLILKGSYINFKVYRKTVCPKGNPIEYVDRKNRRLWYCPKAIKFKCKKKESPI